MAKIKVLSSTSGDTKALWTISWGCCACDCDPFPMCSDQLMNSPPPPSDENDE